MKAWMLIVIMGAKKQSFLDNIESERECRKYQKVLQVAMPSTAKVQCIPKRGGNVQK